MRIGLLTSPHHLSRSGKWEVMYLCLISIHFAFFYDFSIGFWTCSGSVVFFIFYFIIYDGLYRRDQRKPSTKRKPWVRFMTYSRHERKSNITTIVAIYTDCICGCKYSYYTITVTMVPKFEGGKISRNPRVKCCI
jgi:hypothetical protein